MPKKRNRFAGMTVAEARRIDALLTDPDFIRNLASRLREVRSCRKPGAFKPGGGRYEKKTCVPRRKARKKCRRAGQFKPGGGRYATTSCKVKPKRRSPAHRAENRRVGKLKKKTQTALKRSAKRRREWVARTWKHEPAL